MPGRDQTVRITIGCFGGSRADVTVLRGDLTNLGTFGATCSTAQATSTSADIVLPDGSAIVQVTPDDVMWLAISVQQRAPASPRP